MDPVLDYIARHSSRQSEELAWIQKQTNIRTNHARMLSSGPQGCFLNLLCKLLHPTDILELGTFTGYSAVCLATGMEEGGHLDTLEINDELEDLILEGFERAGVSNMVTLHLGDCKQSLEKLKGRRYDLVYIDANKREYCEYYRLVFDLVRPGGCILADNVLWDGKVAQTPMPQDRQTVGIDAFNKLVASDERVENVILPLRDGLNIIRKKK